MTASPHQEPGTLGTASSRARYSLLAYLLIGGLSYALDLGLLLGLHSAGMALWVAATTGFWSSVVLNFSLNRVAFKVGGRLFGHVARYLILLGVNYVVTLLVVQVADAVSVPLALAKTAAVALTTTWNFWLYRRWVFAE